MPKLRYKEKEGKKEKRSNSKKKKEKPYKPPKIYEEEEGWVPPQHEQDNEWREHLFEVMMQDEGQDPFYSNYNHVQPTPSMTDEEYRQHIVSEMYKRKHKEEIEAEERHKRRKKERKEAKQKEEFERKRLQNIQYQLQELKSKELKLLEYNEKWNKLQELTIIQKKDIPWPIINKEFSLESVKEFLINITNSNNKEELKKMIRKEQTRYHPDKFITKYIIKKFKGTDKERESVIRRINEISGWMNELWSKKLIFN